MQRKTKELDGEEEELRRKDDTPLEDLDDDMYRVGDEWGGNEDLRKEENERNGVTTSNPPLSKILRSSIDSIDISDYDTEVNEDDLLLEAFERIKVQENIRSLSITSPISTPKLTTTTSKSPREYNPLPQETFIQDSISGTQGDKYVIIMVGLPARGKTYISRRLARYLEFFHDAPTKVFNVGNYRRKKYGYGDSHFFDPANEIGIKIRHECAFNVLNELKEWLKEGKDLGKVAIYDATNSTEERRKWILNELYPSVVTSKSHVIFIESITNNDKLIDENIAATKLQSPDYTGMEVDKVIKDFKERIAHYVSVYQTIKDESLSWIKLKNAGENVVSNLIKGFLPGRILHFVMNLHTHPRSIYLSRHGESIYNKLGKIGGDSGLSELGEKYALALGKYVNEVIIKENIHTRLWHSSLKRTKLTGRYINHDTINGWVIMRPKVWRALDEIHAGIFDGMTYKQIEEIAPDEFKSRKKNKLSYRYPRGESYLDVLQRLDPIIHELERSTDPVFIIGHQGILRIIYSYFMGLHRDETAFVNIAFNTVTKLTPLTYICKEEKFVLLGDGEHDMPSH